MRPKLVYLTFVAAICILDAAPSQGQELRETELVITNEVHHVGDGIYGNTHVTDVSPCPRRFALQPAEAPMYRAEFFFTAKAIASARLTIESICGKDPEPIAIEIVVNGRQIGQVSEDALDLSFEIPADLLELGGKRNVLRIIGPTLDGDVDDMEFRGIRVLYTSSPEVIDGAELAFLLANEGNLTPVGPDGVGYGEVFVVEVTFTQPQEEPTVYVDLNWDGASQPYEARLERADNTGTLYRSPELRTTYLNGPGVEPVAEPAVEP